MAEAKVTDLVDEMLAAAGDRDLWIVGGGKVASQFADHDLLDRVEVTVVPVVLGEGKPLFERPLSGGSMQLVDARTFASGMVGLTYERASGAAAATGERAGSLSRLLIRSGLSS